ncbi:MAG TPA: SDR family NAD(P)-dependent oxidoreductase [Candidatus Dormibacteraeota bacterium]|nr:SDR family NAD(P)-dependent oxidoreductase [Candidatus Dormibacteraeota bacterium]
MGKLANKVALVTGAGAGIGRAVALAMAAEGAVVGALDRDRDRAEATAAMAEGVIPLAADVADSDQMRAAVDRIAAERDRLDIIVANAGINGVWAPIEEIEPEEWERTMAVNLRGTFLTFKHAVPWLRRQGGAALVTSSVHGTRIFSAPGSTAYACTKAAQLTFARKMAIELARDRVRVNVICPGYIATQIQESTERRHLDSIRAPVEYLERPIPLTHGEVHQPQDIARVAVFLASDDAFPVTGSEVYADGATSLLVG